MSHSVEHPQTRGEEIANSISHGIGVLAVLIGAPFLIIHAIRTGTAWDVAGAGVFIGCASLLYLGSTLYHAIPHAKVRRVFYVLDHGGIFLLIAGTYTPFLLGVLRGGLGWTMFSIIWALTALGITLKAVGVLRHRGWSNLLYLGMGWMVILVAQPLWVKATPLVFVWLLGGGLFYSLGILFYNAKRLRYAHFIWHLFVIAGTALHYFAVFKFA